MAHKLCWSHGYYLQSTQILGQFAIPFFALGRFYGKEIAVGDLRHTIAEMKKLPKAKQEIREVSWFTSPKINEWISKMMGWKKVTPASNMLPLLISIRQISGVHIVFVAQWYFRWFDLSNEPSLLSKFIHMTKNESNRRWFASVQVDLQILNDFHWWGLCSWWTFTEAQHHCHGAANTHTDAKEATNPQSGRRLALFFRELLNCCIHEDTFAIKQGIDQNLMILQVLTFLPPWKRSPKWWKKWSINLRKTTTLLETKKIQNPKALFWRYFFTFPKVGIC